MAGTIVISTIQLDSGNDFTIVSNTGTTLVSANASGINAAVSIADGTITANKLALTYSSDAFVANGTGNTYTVTTGHDANSVLVFLNGICMLPVSDYAISGTTLTFTFLPTANSNVSVRYLPV